MEGSLMIRWLAVGSLSLFAMSAHATTGGPDLYGYRWVDMDEQDGPSIDEWQEGWTTGRPVIEGDDQCLTDNPNTPDQAAVCVQLLRHRSHCAEHLL